MIWNGEPFYAKLVDKNADDVRLRFQHHDKIAEEIINRDQRLKELYDELSKRNNHFKYPMNFIIAYGYVLVDENGTLTYNSLSTPAYLIDEITEGPWKDHATDAALEIATYSISEQNILEDLYNILLAGRREAGRIRAIFDSCMKKKKEESNKCYFITPNGKIIRGAEKFSESLRDDPIRRFRYSISHYSSHMSEIAMDYIYNNPDVLQEYKATQKSAII